MALPAQAQDYFKGRTVRLIVATPPGGGYDSYGRLVARHLGEHLPGHPTIVVINMPGRPPIRLLGGALTITLTRNGGAAFSIGGSMTIVFTAIALGVVIYILRTARNLRSIGWAVTLGLLLGGATGNLLDRIFRAPGLFQGHVVDWIELPDWPVFNLADSAIVCAGVLVVLLALLGIRMDGTRPARESA